MRAEEKREEIDEPLPPVAFEYRTNEGVVSVERQWPLISERRMNPYCEGVGNTP